MPKHVALPVALALITAAATAHHSPPFPVARRPCEIDSAYHALDFWVGDWDVVADGKTAGHDRVERILGGCALVENWSDADGGEGKSLFYYHPAQRQWKQVWVTDDANVPGGLKEKHLVARYDDAGMRFQGEIALPKGGVLLDRTTLTPLSDGRVHQVIEGSRDGGRTWKTGFDAYYARRR